MRGPFGKRVKLMHRPTRQHRHLVEKIENKKTRAKKNGKKTKRWTKWAESYKGLNQDAGEAS